MIDYGQVKRLTDYERHYLARTIVALSRQDREKIHELCLEAGYQSKHMNKDVMFNMSRIALDQGTFA